MAVDRDNRAYESTTTPNDFPKQGERTAKVLAERDGRTVAVAQAKPSGAAFNTGFETAG